MPTQEQIEIIQPNGDIVFHPLNQQEGITNIGRHPDNDVVIEDATFPAFFAILDHRQIPYSVIVLNEQSHTQMEGQAIPAHTPTPIPRGISIKAHGYILVVMQGNATATLASHALVPTDQTATTLAPAAAALGATPFFDKEDEFIFAEISTREWELQVEETATCQLTIGNGGVIVASFHIQVLGIDPAWITIYPETINLHEAEREGVTIAITPPRDPSSRAGIHYLAIEITVPEYPGHVARLSATLTLAPYHEFIVGALSPVRQNVSWRKRIGHAQFSIINKSNTPAEFQLNGEDEERRCFVEFLIRTVGQEQTLARQAKVTIKPNQKIDVPVTITPPKPKLIGVRGHTYSLMFSTTLVGQEQAPHTLMTQVTSKPILGPIMLALFAVMLAILAVIIARPRIHNFAVHPTTVETGKPVTLNWTLSPFVGEISIDGLEQDITKSQNELALVPEGPAATYRLRANNFISRFFPLINLEATTSRTILVLPQPPVINTFSTDQNIVIPEEPLTIKWSVSYADEIILIVNGSEESIPAEEFNGERILTLDEDSLIALEVKNSSGATLKSKFIKARVPLINEFAVLPTEITAGQEVIVSWNVSGSDTVTISPLPDTLPNRGSVPHYPMETTNYVLTLPAGKTEIKEVRSVVVNPKTITETMASEPPVIEFFTATPSEVSANGAVVQLAWSVTGKVTNVAVDSLTSFKDTNLEAQEIITITLDETMAFILTAYNGALSVSQVVEVTQVEGEPTEEEIAAEAQPEIVFFKLEGTAGFEGDVTFQRQESDDGWPLYIYTVAPNSKVLFSWETANADEAMLNREAQPPSGSTTRIITAFGVYRLIARNSANGQEAHAIIRTDMGTSTHAPTNCNPITPHAGAASVPTMPIPALQWACTDPDGDAMTYNVSFGTTNPPPQVATNQAPASYTPAGPLQANVTYYWSITASDGSHVTPGPVWRFTTAAPAPCTPTLLAPPDQSTGLARNVTLSWECISTGGGTVAYAVAMSTMGGRLPILVDNISATTYQPPTLTPNTTYYWAIMATDGVGHSMSTTWRFTTGN